MRKIGTILIVAAALLASADEHRYVLSMPWRPQAQFAGCYYAAAHGIFERHGLKVEVRHRPPEQSVFASLREPESDFVVAPLLTALQVRDAGTGLIQIAQISRNSSLMLVGRRSAGIGDRPEELAGRGRALRAAVWTIDFDLLPGIFLDRYAPEAERIALSAGIDLFLWGATDLIAAMEYNEYYQLLAAGIPASDLARFRMRDYGMNIPEDGVYALAETRRRRPADCEAMREAVLEGWREAARNPAETLRLVRRECRKANLPFDPALQAWMFRRFCEDIEFDRPGYGSLSRHDYGNAVRLLMRHHRIRTAPPLEEFAPFNDKGGGR